MLLFAISYTGTSASYLIKAESEPKAIETLIEYVRAISPAYQQPGIKIICEKKEDHNYYTMWMDVDYGILSLNYMPMVTNFLSFFTVKQMDTDTPGLIKL